MPQKDDELLQELLQKYARMFMKLARNRGVPYDDAEDIVMDAIWSFYNSKHYGNLSESEMKVMMARIVINKCIDRHRKYHREKEGTVSVDVADITGICAPRHLEPERKAVSADNYRRIRETIENLKPVWRDTAIMYFIEERTHAEISKALGVSEEVCRARISRARKYLEEELKEFLPRR